MGQYYLKKLNMICLDADELEKLIYSDWFDKLGIEMVKRELTVTDLHTDHTKMEEITDKVVADNKRHKEDIELFMAWESCLTFFPKDSKICFPLKRGLDLKKRQIGNLEDLKDSIEIDNDTDFAIMSGTGLR